MANDVAVIPAVTGDQIRAAIGQTMMNIDSGAATPQDVEAIAKLADSWVKLIQVQLNSVKTEIECKKNGHDFGKAMKRAKKLVQDGYQMEEQD